MGLYALDVVVRPLCSTCCSTTEFSNPASFVGRTVPVKPQLGVHSILPPAVLDLHPRSALLLLQRRAMLGLPEGDTDPFFDTIKDQGRPADDGGYNDDDDESAGDSCDSRSDTEYEFEKEPPELLAARQQLASYTARPGEEEPPELSAARRKMAQQGQPIQEGSWSQAKDSTTGNAAAATAPANSEDGLIYLASVKASQQELDRAGSAAAGAGRAAATALGPTTDAGPGGLDFSRLRAAREAALAAVGLTDEVAGGISSNASSTGLQTGDFETSGNRKDTGAGADTPGSSRAQPTGEPSTMDIDTAQAHDADLVQQQEARQQTSESPNQQLPYMSGSWSSRSSDDAAGNEGAVLDSRSAAGIPRAELEGGAADAGAAEDSQHGVAPEGVLLTSEASATVPHLAVHAAVDTPSTTQTEDSLYDPD
eukprot:GHUV01034073.1.p1 GENE.GHUV01034073.1~~GHUV01034073.1.p1  ORF type:complete len:424 (+),score=175.32 GHUV01034073.1:512-1783(+)